MRKTLMLLLVVLAACLAWTQASANGQENTQGADTGTVLSSWLIYSGEEPVGNFTIELWEDGGQDRYFINLNGYYSHEVQMGPVVDPPYYFEFPNGCRGYFWFTSSDTGLAHVMNPALSEDLVLVRVDTK